ncbi:MAG: hypothetical protein GY947_18155 [Rhodobacteraceae bacterium]|nr:hypothetical protein [Paracoccaceae bacterium]
MANWSDCRKFDEFQYEENRQILVGRAGVYQFGYFSYGEFQPKYIGRVLWTPNGYDFYKRFMAYKNKAHNPKVAAKIAAQRKMLWFRVMSVQDPAWTESRFLLTDRDENGNFMTFEWNSIGSNYYDDYFQEDWRSYYTASYQ